MMKAERANSECGNERDFISLTASHDREPIPRKEERFMVDKVPYKRIATEEAFATHEQFRLFGKLLDSGYDDPGFKSLWGFYLRSEAERPKLIRDRLLDLGPRRIADMDATGIDMQLLLFTAPGVNPLNADEAR